MKEGFTGMEDLRVCIFPGTSIKTSNRISSCRVKRVEMGKDAEWIDLLVWKYKLQIMRERLTLPSQIIGSWGSGRMTLTGLSLAPAQRQVLQSLNV